MVKITDTWVPSFVTFVCVRRKMRKGTLYNANQQKHVLFMKTSLALAVVLGRMPHRVGFSHAVKAALYNHVHTEYVIVIQHDLAFVRRVYLGPLLHVLETFPDDVKYITLPGKKHLGVQHHILSKYKVRVQPTRRFGVGLVPVIYWYDKTHICRSEFYRDFVYGGGSGVSIPIGQFTEHVLGAAERADISANGMACAHGKYGTYQVCARPQQLHYTSTHLLRFVRLYRRPMSQNPSVTSIT